MLGIIIGGLFIRSYSGKNTIVSEFESFKVTTKINQRRIQNKTRMEDTTT